MTAWSYCAMAPLNDGSGAKAMKCSQLSKYNLGKRVYDIVDIYTLCYNIYDKKINLMFI